MHDLTQRRAGTALAAVLVTDGLFHLVWSTGSTWPASNERSLSLAVLGTDVSFAAPVTLPLATILFIGAGGVLVHSHRIGEARARSVAAAITAAVAVGLMARAAAGIVWAFGIGVGDGPDYDAFRVLNLLLYTPVCVAFGITAARLVNPRELLGRLAGSRKRLRSARRSQTE